MRSHCNVVVGFTYLTFLFPHFTDSLLQLVYGRFTFVRFIPRDTVYDSRELMRGRNFKVRRIVSTFELFSLYLINEEINCQNEHTFNPLLLQRVCILLINESFNLHRIEFCKCILMEVDTFECVMKFMRSNSICL